VQEEPIVANKPDEEAFKRELARIARESDLTIKGRIRAEAEAERERQRKAKEDEAKNN
jgi:hypothetical protein